MYMYIGILEMKLISYCVLLIIIIIINIINIIL